MRKITFLTLLLIASFGAFSQSNSIIDYFDWSNPTTFNLSPSPVITGYGFYSDSLSEAFDDKTFYEYNDDYYCIESWADYYYWFTQKYSYQFNDPQLYEYYYWIKDDYGMASYITSYKYLGKYYPSLIKLNFGDLTVKNNRLINDKFFAQNDKEIKRFTKQLSSTKSVNNYSASNSQNQSVITRSPKTVKRGLISNNKIHQINHQSTKKITSNPKSSTSSPKKASTKGNKTIK